MPFTVSVRLPRRSPTVVDVVVDATPGRTVADLRPRLADLLGEPVPALTWDGVLLDDGLPVGVPPLVHGASIAVPGMPPAPAPVRPRSPGVPVDVAVVSGPDCGRTLPLPPDGLTVGRSAGCALALDDAALSRRHARLSVTASGVVVHDLGATNGVAVDGMAIGRSAAAIRVGSRVRLGDTIIRLTRSGRTAVPTTATGTGYLLVHRSSRVLPSVRAAEIAAPEPPEPPTRGRGWWVAAIATLPVAAVLALLFGPRYLAFAAAGPLMMATTAAADRMGSRRTHRDETAAYRQALTERRESLADALEDERRRHEDAHPDPATVLRVAEGPGHRLWERDGRSAGALVVRVAVGTLPARTTWLEPDGRPSHPDLDDVPVTVDLAAVRVLGLAGSTHATTAVARVVIGQLGVLLSPRDLRVWPARATAPPRVGMAGLAPAPGTARRPTGPGAGCGRPLAPRRPRPHRRRRGRCRPGQPGPGTIGRSDGRARPRPGRRAPAGRMRRRARGVPHRAGGAVRRW